MKAALKFPKRFPTAWELSKVAFPPSKSALMPKTVDGRTRKPQVSYGRQERLKNVCIMAGIDPSPYQWQQPPVKKKSLNLPSLNMLMKSKPVVAYERAKKIEDNLAKSDEKVAAWRAERRKAHDSSKSYVPF